MKNLDDQKTKDDPKNTYKFFKHDRRNRIRYFKNAQGEIISTQYSKEDEDRRRIERKEFERMFKLCEEKLIKPYEHISLFSSFLTKQSLYSLHWKLYTSFPTLEPTDKDYNLVRKERDRTRDILIDLLRKAIEQKDFGLFQATFRFFDSSYYAPIISFFGSGKNIGIFFYPTFKDIPSIYLCQSIGQDLQERRIDEKEATEFAKEFFSSIFLRCSADEEIHFNADHYSLMGQKFQWAGFESDQYILNNLYMLRYDTPSYHAYCRHTKDDEGDIWLYLVHFCRKDSQQETLNDPAI